MKVFFVAKDVADLSRFKERGSLRGQILESEQIVHLFPADCAPSGTQAMDVRIVRYDGKYFVEGLQFGKRFPVEIYSFDEINVRTPFKPHHQAVLATAVVFMIAVGSLGSAIARLLAAAGVGKLILCDPGIFNIHNIARHEGNLLDLGRSKVEIVADRLRMRNPLIEVETHAEDIFQWPDDKLALLFERSDVATISSDKMNVQLMANEYAMDTKTPAVYGGCYEGARGGESFMWLPDSEAMACYACLRGGFKFPDRTGKVDYSNAEGPEDYEAEPGLHAGVMQVAAAAAQMTLGILLRDQPDSQLGALTKPENQFLLIGTALSEDFYRFRRPFDCFFQPLSGPRKACPVCGEFEADAALIHEEMGEAS